MVADRPYQWPRIVLILMADVIVAIAPFFSLVSRIPMSQSELKAAATLRVGRLRARLGRGM